jgi:hypothetical protein
MTELTIQIPDDLALRLQPVQDRLIEIIELGLQKITQTQYGLHNEVTEFLASSPGPQAIVNFHPSAEAQARVTELLEKDQAGALSPDEQAELDQYENLDYIMTLVKAQARRRLSLAQ